MFFFNKGFHYINLNSIFNLDNVKNLFLEKLKIDEPPSVVYSLGKTIRNKILNYKETTSSIYPNDDITYSTSIVEYYCQQQNNFADENHGHVLTGVLRIMTNSKLRKLICKGPNFPENKLKKIMQNRNRD